LAERKPSEIEVMMGWSLEAFYQLLLANHATTKQIENQRKTAESAMSAKKGKAHLK
jgi:hypothetical protein